MALAVAESMTRPRATPPRPTPIMGRLDALIVAGYLALAAYVLSRLWIDPTRNSISGAGKQDHDQTEWFLSHAAYAITHGTNPLQTDRLNVPDGVNLMANTSVIGLGIPMTPITLTLGPHVTYLILLTLGLAGTATTWYFFLRKLLGCSAIAAGIGAGLCGFGPAMISHSNGHLNFISQFLVPIIIWRTFKLFESERIVRNGIFLGLVVTYQIFIGEEILLFTALACAIFLTAWALMERARARACLPLALKGLGIGIITASTLVAYPLYVQFFGPQHYNDLPPGASHISSDLLSIGVWPHQSVGETMFGTNATEIMLNTSEGNLFFGWVLPLLVVGCVVMLWRDRLVRALALTAAFFLILAMGPQLSVGWERQPVWLPWNVFKELPLLEHVVPSRFGLVVLPIIGILIALGIDQLRQHPPAWRRWGYVSLAMALVPLMPLPIQVEHRRPTPAFLADGLWRSYISAGQTVVTIPLPAHDNDAMRWAAEGGLAYTMPRGYFLSPINSAGDAGFGPTPRPTSTLLTDVAHTGQTPTITDKHRQQAQADLRFWRAGVVILAPQPTQEALLATATQLFGPPLLGPSRASGGVWLWDIGTV